jgi:hypothetical protein
LGKVNYLRRFISNMAGKFESLLPLVRLKQEKDFAWGALQREAFDRIKKYLTWPLVLQAPRTGMAFRLYVAASDKSVWGGADAGCYRQRGHHCLSEQKGAGYGGAVHACGKIVLGIILCVLYASAVSII